MGEAGYVSPWRNYSLEENLDIVVCIETLEHPYKVADRSQEPTTDGQRRAILTLPELSDRASSELPPQTFSEIDDAYCRRITQC